MEFAFRFLFLFFLALPISAACDLTTSTAAFWPTEPKTPSDSGVILHTYNAQNAAFRVPVGLYTVVPTNWNVEGGYVTWYCNNRCTDNSSPGGCTARAGAIMSWIDDVAEDDSYRQCLMDSVVKQGGQWAPLDSCEAAWSFVDEDTTTFTHEFFTDADVAALQTGESTVECDLTFYIQRDDSESRSYFKYYDLDTKQVRSQSLRGGYQDHQNFQLAGCTQMKCSNGNARSASCPWTSKNMILMKVYLAPKEGAKAHRNQWRRNKYTFTGSYYRLKVLTTTTTTAVATCERFSCGADAVVIPNAALVEGNDFATCCQCQFGSHLLWGAHANGTFHRDPSPGVVEMWLDIPQDVTMEEINWANAQSDDLRYKRGQSQTNWNFRSEGECRTRWTLDEDLNTFFGAGSRFTYDRAEDLLEGMFEFKADRSMSRIISGHENVYVRHITQDVPVIFSLEKTATVEATFETSVTALEYDIAITGIAEQTFSENGEIVLNFNVLSSSCMEKSVTLKSGGESYIDGAITSTWSDESMWHPDGVNTASCSQDVTVTFKRKQGVFNLPLVFLFQIQAKNNEGDIIEEEVNLHIEEPSILDSLPIQTTMSFYLTEARTAPADSFGLGHTVYGRITTATVVDVDSIALSSLVLEQVGYDNEMQTFDIMNLAWAEYTGEYPAGADHFDFSFMLKSTDLHITASSSADHLAEIKAAIAVTYKDQAHTRRQLAIAPPSAEANSDAEMTVANSFAITDDEENVGALFEITRAHKSHFLKWAAAGGFLALFFYCVRRQMKYQNESYSPLLVDDEI